jgi:hypothetical protein
MRLDTSRMTLRIIKKRKASSGKKAGDNPGSPLDIV